MSGKMTILADRPSMGKTDLMLHFAKMSGWAGFLPLFFSLEMPEKHLLGVHSNARGARFP
ncbi:DnaB-like helicase C-terminal domain-containing protein [Bacillus sp. UNC41MFS5]|uniref:DnaB-like helicase C-terminal domain-containing protein n=1 Tax=Bacillus sp. UNC41MFS5 TaxID=1449046 RepID=UPI00047E26BE|nr:DnaB-like helicase C-terminal domain-containing protein [Bacillus sp. UNC41MFS5]